jgi:lipopolysaccharide transport system ATP-binding protein
MSGAISISCRGVSKRYALLDAGNAWRFALGISRGIPRFEALSDVTFDVPKGQFVGVLGRNGAGKSTLLRTVGGVYSADEGSVSVKGALSGLYELGLVGNPQLTGREYAGRLLQIHGFRDREREAMTQDIQEFSELEDRFNDPVQTYSAGMMGRLFFSTATAGSYQVYLLDEILAVGDQHFQAKCWRRLRERISRGASGVLVTHDWSAILRMCETAHILENGRVSYSGPAERAVRLYLYGERAQESFKHGIASFVRRPADKFVVKAGADFTMLIEAEILQAADVGIVFVIERLQPSLGWETALMSRRVERVGEEPGRYAITIAVPRLPLEPGEYKINLHLVMPDPTMPGRRIALDGYSWLNGDGLTITVEQTDGRVGLTLPVTWSVGA